jgi:hypothetical protein
VRVAHELRAIYLENEYLKCSVPDPGTLYTCFDKISGLPMFYANPSIKKAKLDIAGPGRFRRRLTRFTIGSPCRL